MRTSPTTGDTPNSATSPKPCSGSCAKPCRSGSTNSRRPSPTISASSTRRNFGSSRNAAISSDRHENQGGLRELSTRVVGGLGRGDRVRALVAPVLGNRASHVKPHVRILARRKKRSFQQRGIRLANPPPRRGRLDLRHKKLSVRRQCALLGLARSGVKKLCSGHAIIHQESNFIALIEAKLPESDRKATYKF